jgi:capsular polysaccharide biosynthesis protein
MTFYGIIQSLSSLKDWVSMELMLFLQVLLRRWWLVLVPVVVVAAITIPDFLSNRGAISGGYTTTIRYTASQVLEAIPGRDGDFQDVWLASELAVNALTDWVRTSSFVSEITTQTSAQNVHFDPAVLGIAADNERSVGQLTMSYPDLDTLDAIVDAAVDVLQSRAQFYFPQLGGQPAQVRILDVPTLTAAPPPITNRLAPFIKIAMGLLAGVALAFLAEYLDPTLRRRQQVEMLGLPVVGILPRD